MNPLELSTIDPAAPLDDLEPLAELLAGARVIAIGENAHLISEFYRIRHRLQRFLSARLGFTAYAMETGFSEGLEVDAGIRDASADLRKIADEKICYTMGRCAEMRDHLTWMRSAEPPVRFFGLDVPGSTASPLAALANIRDFLHEADPGAVAVVDRLTAAVSPFAGEHALPAYAAYGALSAADRDEITAVYADLSTRFDALEPEYHAASYAVVRHELRLAVLLDQAMRVYAAQVTTPGGIPTIHPRVAPRDRGMAETVLWLLDHLGPDAKIIVAAHNSHIQRVPVQTPAFALSAAGHHLANRLGPEYLAIGVTCTGGRTSTHRPDPGVPGGVAIVGADLDAPEPGSIEAAMPDRLCAVDLRPLRAAAPPGAPDRIRVMNIYQPTPVLDAFDLMINIPSISTTSQVSPPG
ncbi:erythromycin esterase family protein [Actinoplanes sp. NPDC051851]|uniref:erythromycin esterase family protein n=1 Tax=Actinoplanes sp. NPDC051851 TaxID=3154753 RepID=UPI003439533C